MLLGSFREKRYLPDPAIIRNNFEKERKKANCYVSRKSYGMTKMDLYDFYTIGDVFEKSLEMNKFFYKNLKSNF